MPENYIRQGIPTVEVTQFMPDEEKHEDANETASRLRLQADLDVEKINRNERNRF